MKYTVTMSCGHEEKVSLLGKNEEREKRIKFYESSGLCRECYKKMEEKQNEQELIFRFSVLYYIDQKTGSILLSASFEGNTKPYKDTIKSLGGYRWGERETSDDLFSYKRPSLCWRKTIKLEELENEISKAVSIGAKVISNPSLFESGNYHTALEEQREWKQKREKIESIRPIIPEKLKGHKWNQKIYGKPGNYSIYPDGNKVNITDDEAAEISKYLKEKEIFKQKEKEILESERWWNVE